MEPIQKVQKFLQEIKPEDKFAIICHDDLDGFASAILFSDFLEEKGCKAQVFPKRIEKDMFKNIEKETKDANKVIILDIAPNLISKDFKKLEGKQVLYIDHHKSESAAPRSIIEYRTESEYPVSRTCFELIGGKHWLAVAGVIADAGDKFEENFDFIKNFLEENKITLEDFKEKVAYRIGYFIIYFEEDLKEAFDILKKAENFTKLAKIKGYATTVEREAKKYKADFSEKREFINGIYFYYFEPKFNVRNPLINEISYENPSGIYIFAIPSENLIKIEARCQTKRVNMIELLKHATQELEDASSGGHPVSAGALIRKEDLKKFKENLKTFKIETPALIEFEEDE